MTVRLKFILFKPGGYTKLHQTPPPPNEKINSLVYNTYLFVISCIVDQNLLVVANMQAYNASVNYSIAHPPPGQPPGICTFFFFKLTIPRGRAGKAWQCPAPGQKKDDKCPAPGHTDSFIECILDLKTSISVLVSLYKCHSSHPNL